MSKVSQIDGIHDLVGALILHRSWDRIWDHPRLRALGYGFRIYDRVYSRLDPHALLSNIEERINME